VTASASDEVKKYCVAAVHEYIVIVQRRRIVEICGERGDEIENTMADVFLTYVAAWSKNDILMAIARAFDRHPDTASVPNGLKYIGSHFRAVARSDCSSEGLDACVKRYDYESTRKAEPGPDANGAKIEAIVRGLHGELEGLEQPLAAIKKRRDKLLAHRSREGVPQDDLVWGDITAVQRFMVRYIDCLVPMFDWGGGGYTCDGEFAVSGIETPWISLERLLDALSKPRDDLMPEGYRLDNWRSGCWRARRPDGSPFSECTDPDEALAAAWLDSVGRSGPAAKTE